jgi:molecular chaperone HscB
MAMIRCPSCASQAEPRLYCSGCGAPLPIELDCFAAFGIPRRLTLDSQQLEQTYHELSRRVHPDRFATRPATVRDASLRATALLTRSYRTLRDPISRGRYWLELNGEKLAENNKQVPPRMAELVFEVQEQLEELRDSPRDGAPRSALADQVRIRRSEVQSAMDEALSALDSNFAAWDAGQRERTVLMAELKTTLSRIAYLQTLIRDVDRELEPALAH